MSKLKTENRGRHTYVKQVKDKHTHTHTHTLKELGFAALGINVGILTPS